MADSAKARGHLRPGVDGSSTRIGSHASTSVEIALAWRASSHGVRLAALTVGVCGLLAATRREVPMVSGVAVATLVPAALVDLHVRRLPNRLSALAAVLLLVVGAVNGDLRPAGLAAGAALFAGPILVVHLWSPDAMGFGDVKAAVVLGAALGLVHWQLPVVALALATGATAAVGLTARARELPFGPGLVAGSALALAACTAFIPPSVDTAIAADRAPGQPDAATLPGGDRST